MKDRVLGKHLSRWEELGSPKLARLSAAEKRQISDALLQDALTLRIQKNNLAGGLAIPVGEIPSVVASVCRREKLPEVSRVTTERIASKTDVLLIFYQLGLDGSINGGLGIDSYGGYSVRWGDHSIRADGSFHPDEGIKIKRRRPTGPSRLITSLASSGIIDPVSSIVTHEVVHAVQRPKSKHLAYSPVAREMREVHAYRSDGLLSIATEDKLRFHIMSARSNGVLVYPYADVNMVNGAIWAVDRMQVLGLNPEEIINMVSEYPQWDEARRSFPLLKIAILAAAAKVGLSGKDLSILVEAHRIQRSAHRFYARHLAQEVLKEAA